MTSPSPEVHLMDEVLAGLSASEIAIPENRIRAAAIVFGQQTGHNTAIPPTTAERIAIGEWLQSERQHGLRGTHHGSIEDRRVIHESWIAKATWLQQRPCDICDTWTGPGIQVSFDVPIAPFSAQSPPQRLKDLKGRVHAQVGGQAVIAQRWRHLPVCLQVVAVLGLPDRRKDADNLIKGFMDALQGVLFEDDVEVQHLDVARIRCGIAEGMYLVRARPARALDEDVLDLHRQVRWRQRLDP